ncbi:MAG: flagellar biosynthetic protein FliO [Saccharospirillum sp.]
MNLPAAFKKLTVTGRMSVGWLLLLGSGSTTLANGPLPGGSSDYIKLTLTLIFIVGLILACAWLVRRMSGGAGFNQRHMKVLSVMPLGTREKLMLVKAGEEYLLLGVTPHSINTLHRYDEPVDLAETHLSSPFADRMKGLLKGLDSDPLAKHKAASSQSAGNRRDSC